MSIAIKGLLAFLAVVATSGVASAQVITGPEGNYHTPESLYGQYQGQGNYVPGYRGYPDGYGRGYGYARSYAYPQPYGYTQPQGYYGSRTTPEGDYRY